MSDLANVYSSKGKLQEAEALQQKTLEIQRRVLGPEHTHTLITMNNLALSYLEQKRFDEAEKMLRETLVLDTRVRGKDHPFTLDTEFNIAVVLAQSGRRAEGLRMLRDIVQRGFAGEWLEDSMLEPLRNDTEFMSLVAEVKKRKQG